MKRTTVFADDETLRKLREIAKRENISLAQVTRKALTEYVSRRRPEKSPPLLDRDWTERPERHCSARRRTPGEGFGR